MIKNNVEALYSGIKTLYAPADLKIGIDIGFCVEQSSNISSFGFLSVGQKNVKNQDYPL